jgi:Uma2 family endonuclease
MTWQQVCEDKTLANLPFKIELDGSGKLIMSPAHKKHSRLQSKLQRLFSRLLPHGDPLPECAVETANGTRVADVAWISEERWASMNPDEASCTTAPEICVEILSPANTREEMLGTLEKPGKRELYFQVGAREFWLSDESGRLSFFNRSGQIPKSELCPEFPDKV